MNLAEFTARWSASGAEERANKDLFLTELCDVLGVARPDPKSGDPTRDTYVFEMDAVLVREGERSTVGKIDLYRAGRFILEAKQGSQAGSKKYGTARRETPAWALAMEDARGQGVGYASTIDKPPPFLIVCDIGHCFDLYAAFDASGVYRPYPHAQAKRIFFKDLEKHVGTLQKVWEDPHALDLSKAAAKVTRDVAGRLADLARSLEKSGHPPATVATFLMRCLFTMFAEDVGLLPEKAFENAIKQFWLPNPASFPGGIESLWNAMNQGGNWILGRMHKFNGGLFAQPAALPLDAQQLELLGDAAGRRWSDVEPAIFGTLLERALDPAERHKLGAHFTPRAYVERLVQPTIEAPLRADWDIVKAEVRRLVGEPKPGAKVSKRAPAEKALKTARGAVHTFRKRLSRVSVLDPACGSGNFLYVTLDLLMRIEDEVVALLADLGEAGPKRLGLEGDAVTPAQFHGIEVKRWAKEIAELVLWIGFLQNHARRWRTARGVGWWPNPVLQDLHNIECRDAVLAWDGEPKIVRGEDGKPVTRWDGVSYKKSHVTGEDVPDESRKVPVLRYRNPRQAEWPRADYVVGNPPFLGKLRIISSLGEGYADALRTAYSGVVPDSADFVMYWWHRGARAVAGGDVHRSGLVTTNSITQHFNRRVVEAALEGTPRVHLSFAVPDHPWVASEDGAAVRIALTVVAPGAGVGRLLQSRRESETPGEASISVEFLETRGVIHADLSTGANVSAASKLKANVGVTSNGVMLGGRGFLVEHGAALRGPPEVVRPLLNGNDVLQRSRHAKVIDFFGLDENEARKKAPDAYQQIVDRVKPERDQNPRPARRARWWLFSEVMPQLRAMLAGVRFFVGTPETSKHRLFVRVDARTLPEHPLIAIALDDPFYLGVLSSRAHRVWSLAAGGTLEDRPRYNKSLCFETFAFPLCSRELMSRVGALAELLDVHRKHQQSVHPALTITAMYNVLEKLRSGEPLVAKEHVVHEQGLVSMLKQVHDDIDAAVFDAYGWAHDLPDEHILERLVALNAQRAEEERNGVVRWLRPEFQNPSGRRSAMQTSLAGTEDGEGGEPHSSDGATTWPKRMAEQVAAVRDRVERTSSAWTVEQVRAAFTGAKVEDVEDVLDSLAALGVVVAYVDEGDGGKRWRSIARPSS